MRNQKAVALVTFKCDWCGERSPASQIYAHTGAFTVCSQACAQAWWRRFIERKTQEPPTLRAYCEITVPDGRRFAAVERGTYAYDTKAWIPRHAGMTIINLVTGEACPPRNATKRSSVKGK